MAREQEMIEVPTVGGRKPRLLSHQVLTEILEPRAEEIFSLIHDEVARAGFDKSLNAGIVLTGGGSLLPGVTEVAEQVFDVPVRLGYPTGVHGLGDPEIGPPHTAAIGLALHGARNHKPRKRISIGMPAAPFVRFGDRMRSWLSEMF
jgi:cell division protein FtsA